VNKARERAEAAAKLPRACSRTTLETSGASAVTHVLREGAVEAKLITMLAISLALRSGTKAQTPIELRFTVKVFAGVVHQAIPVSYSASTFAVWLGLGNAS
jgi:hypothetical protein